MDPMTESGHQLDLYEVLSFEARERAYAHSEREGKRLNDILCDECPDPGTCGAEGECVGRAWAQVDGELDVPEWDAVS